MTIVENARYIVIIIIIVCRREALGDILLRKILHYFCLFKIKFRVKKLCYMYQIFVKNVCV